jgi:hypothetical protein
VKISLAAPAASHVRRVSGLLPGQTPAPAVHVVTSARAHDERAAKLIILVQHSHWAQDVSYVVAWLRCAVLVLQSDT